MLEDDDALVGAWESAGAKILALSAAGVVPGQMLVVRYLGSKLAPIYRIVLDVLVAEESQLGLQLPTATIAHRATARIERAAGGSVPCPPVAKLLDQLYEWGNVDRIHNTHRKGDYQEYLRQDYLYQMTPAGTIVHRELTRIDQELGITGALQASMLPEVLQALVALATALNIPEEKKRNQQAYIAFSRVVNGFTQLSENAKLFVQGLNRSLHLDSKEKAESFLAYKRVVVDYLQTFSIGIAKFAAGIAEAIEAAEGRGVLSALPQIAGVEAAPALGVSAKDATARDAGIMRAQWLGLRRWFFPDGDQQPVVTTLADRSVDAISRIMTTVRQLNDERFRRVDRKADLVTMARWFSDGETDVVSLWRSGFGLYPTRHLGAPHPAEAEIDIRPSIGWWEGVAPADLGSPAHARSQGKWRSRVAAARPAQDEEAAERTATSRGRRGGGSSQISCRSQSVPVVESHLPSGRGVRPVVAVPRRRIGQPCTRRDPIRGNQRRTDPGDSSAARPRRRRDDNHPTRSAQHLRLPHCLGRSWSRPVILEETAREEIRKAARFLVLNPLLHPNGRNAKIATLVHNHSKVLKAWFDEYLGWPLVVERDIIRLVKVPEPQAVVHRDDAPTARCCALFCLLLATLEGAGTQTVISELADKVTTIAAATDGIPVYDSTEYSDRKALVQAIRLLTAHGALVPVQDSASTRDDENRYVESAGNALYDVDHRTAALLLACPTPPTRAETYQHLTRQSYPDTVEGANRRRRHAIMRRLVDHPVMYFDELPVDQLDYFRNQHPLFVRQLCEMLDTRLEVRAEGAAVIDEELTDLTFPKDTKDQFAALLFASALADESNAEDPEHVVLDEAVTRIAERTAPHLAARGVKASSPKEVRQAALTVLTKLRLVEPLGDGRVHTLPALGRYRNVPEPAAPQQEPAAMLFALPGDEEPDVPQS